MRWLVDYTVDFSLEGQSGKSKATFDKVQAFKQLVHRLNVSSVTDLATSRPRRFWQMVQSEMRYLFELIRRREKPDVIFSRTFMCFGAFLGGKLFNIPVIREIHADFLDEARLLYGTRGPIAWFARLMQRYMLFFFKRSDGLIFNNPRLADYYRHNLNVSTPSVTVYNGANTSEFFPLPKEDVLQRLGLESGKKYLVFVGSVSPWHGVGRVLEMQQHLLNLRDDTVLLVVGGAEGERGDEISSRFGKPKGVSFVGRVDKKQAMLYINAATVCLLPVEDNRISPGSPIKLYDYISCGKAVVAQAKTPGYSDVVEQYGLGITCDYREPADAAKRIDVLLNELDSASVRKHNRTVAETELSWSRVAEQWLLFASEVLAMDGR